MDYEYNNDSGKKEILYYSVDRIVVHAKQIMMSREVQNKTTLI